MDIVDVFIILDIILIVVYVTVRLGVVGRYVFQVNGCNFMGIGGQDSRTIEMELFNRVVVQDSMDIVGFGKEGGASFGCEEVRVQIHGIIG